MIFTNKVKDFMTNKMCVDVAIYEDRINKYSFKHVRLFQELGTYLHSVKINTNDKYYGTFQVDAYNCINAYDDMCSKTRDTICILINSFMRYRCIGQLNLFYSTETDNWEPLTKVSKSLYAEMPSHDQKTFNNMDEEIFIYRGTCQNEAKDKINSFGQSWTTNIEKAKYFAYELEQEKSETDIRVVIKAKINKKHIYAYCSRGEENLCIINPIYIIKDSVVIVQNIK